MFSVSRLIAPHMYGYVICVYYIYIYILCVISLDIVCTYVCMYMNMYVRKIAFFKTEEPIALFRLFLGWLRRLKLTPVRSSTTQRWFRATNMLQKDAAIEPRAKRRVRLAMVMVVVLFWGSK